MNPQQNNIPHVPSLYEAIGGEATFHRITKRFYEGIESDPLLRPMYPVDLTESIRHMELFLMQYFDGPRTYTELRGHPRLRMRHAPFAIGQQERDAWMKHMRAGVEAENLPKEVEKFMLDYFEWTATFMMNQ